MRNLSHASRTLVLPPVTCPPSSLLMYSFPGGANSTLMLEGATPSSSQIRVGNEVYTPCPISERSHRIVTCPSVPMRSHAFAATCCGGPLCTAFSGLLHPGRCMAMTRPPVVAAAVLRKPRREYWLL